jgi:hypothetical protein
VAALGAGAKSGVSRAPAGRPDVSVASADGTDSNPSEQSSTWTRIAADRTAYCLLRGSAVRALWAGLFRYGRNWIINV